MPATAERNEMKSRLRPFDGVKLSNLAQPSSLTPLVLILLHIAFQCRLADASKACEDFLRNCDLKCGAPENVRSRFCLGKDTTLYIGSCDCNGPNTNGLVKKEDEPPYAQTPPYKSPQVHPEVNVEPDDKKPEYTNEIEYPVDESDISGTYQEPIQAETITVAIASSDTDVEISSDEHIEYDQDELDAIEREKSLARTSTTTESLGKSEDVTAGKEYDDYYSDYNLGKTDVPSTMNKEKERDVSGSISAAGTNLPTTSLATGFILIAIHLPLVWRR